MARNVIRRFRLNQEEEAKLERLAVETDRDRSKLLRRLIRLAIALPDGGLALMKEEEANDD